MKKIRYYIFLKEVLAVTLTAFGGPQAHLAMFTERFVKKRGYLTEEELLELNALCQVLPGPTSTQTVTALGFRIGGPNLAYLTLLVWALPAVLIMTAAGIAFTYIDANSLSLKFTRFIQPTAVGIVAFAAVGLTRSTIKSGLEFTLLLIAAGVCAFIQSPFIFPGLIVLGGLVTATKFKKHPVERIGKFKIKWSNFILFLAIPVVVGIIGLAIKFKPLSLFENFYRIGGLVFGGGDVLVPMMLTEFVEFKHYLTSPEFRSGFALSKALPGPNFSFAAFVGTLSMRGFGPGSGLLGSFIGAAGIFLPGTLLIFFVIRFWDRLKKFRVVRASLRGIVATNAGLMFGAVFLLFRPLDINVVNLSVPVVTFALLFFTKIPVPFLIVAGLAAGFVF